MPIVQSCVDYKYDENLAGIQQENGSIIVKFGNFQQKFKDHRVQNAKSANYTKPKLKYDQTCSNHA